MSEWFYIRQWSLNKENTWCLIDTQGKILISNISRHDADLKKIELENQDIKTYIVNKNEQRYTNLVSKEQRGHNENNNTKI